MAALQRHALPFPRRFRWPNQRFRWPNLAGRLRSGRVLLALAAVLVLAVALLRVNQFSHLTSTGYQIDSLTQLRDAKQAENHQLEADVAQLSSLARVDWEARVNLHMVPATRRLYISVNQPVPARETLPTRFLPQQSGVAAAPAQSDSNSIWERLLKLLPFF
jgi:cell division protein FtsL